MINIIIIKIETDSMTKAGHMLKIEVIRGTIRISEVETTLEIIGIEVNIIAVIEEALKKDTCYMKEVETGIEITEEDLVGKKRGWIDE